MSLGVARAQGDGPWQLIGVLPLFDPPREDAKATLATARQLGVTVKMVTGDALAIAQETAKKLGLGANILDAGGLGDTKRQESKAVTASIEDADGFAQVFPEHKFHIVDVLQNEGHIVGMTGDGVNDAPALKKADCGIAVSGATDAARAAASIVLMTPGLSVIIDAIKESRRIVQRMNSYAIYRIAETLRVLGFVTLVILLFNFFPVTAIMIVLLALLNDGSILSIAYDNVQYKDQPEAWNMRLVLGIASVIGAVGPIAALGLFYLGDKVIDLSRPQLQTMMYLMLSVAGSMTIYLTRTRGPFWSIRPARKLMIAVTGAQIIATVISVARHLRHRAALGIRAPGLGLRTRMVPRHRPREATRLPHPRPCQGHHPTRSDRAATTDPRSQTPRRSRGSRKRRCWSVRCTRVLRSKRRPCPQEDLSRPVCDGEARRVDRSRHRRRPLELGPRATPDAGSRQHRASTLAASTTSRRWAVWSTCSGTSTAITTTRPRSRRSSKRSATPSAPCSTSRSRPRFSGR